MIIRSSARLATLTAVFCGIASQAVAEVKVLAPSDYYSNNFPFEITLRYESGIVLFRIYGDPVSSPERNSVQGHLDVRDGRKLVASVEVAPLTSMGYGENSDLGFSNFEKESFVIKKGLQILKFEIQEALLKDSNFEFNFGSPRYKLNLREWSVNRSNFEVSAELDKNSLAPGESINVRFLVTSDRTVRILLPSDPWVSFEIHNISGKLPPRGERLTSFSSISLGFEPGKTWEWPITIPARYTSSTGEDVPLLPGSYELVCFVPKYRHLGFIATTAFEVNAK
jgi:hypothetical protein